MTNNTKMVTDKAIITTAVQQEVDYGLSNSDILMTLNEPYNPYFKSTPLFNVEYLRNGTR